MNEYSVPIMYKNKGTWDILTISANSSEEAILNANEQLMHNQNLWCYPNWYVYDKPTLINNNTCKQTVNNGIINTYFDNKENINMSDRVELYNYLDWGNYNKNIQVLADMAVSENWNHPKKKDNFILKNYLKYTFWKLQDENKVIETDKYILFNTGLYTDLYDTIYIYGEKHTNPQINWYFKDFMTEYDLGEIGISEFPSRADYFSDPSQLIFDPTLHMNVQYSHILKDANNIERIKDIKCKNVQALIIGEIDKVKKKVAANYQIALPQYYQSKIQLLLPLCLEDGETPYIALVVTRMDGYYQAHTCLSLDMAYNNARLIAKPESNWLSI